MRFPYITESESLLSHSQKTATGHLPEANKSSLHPLELFRYQSIHL